LRQKHQTSLWFCFRGCGEEPSRLHSERE